MLDIELSNRQTRHPVDAERLQAAVRLILAEEEFSHAEISLAVVDDPTMHELNRRYLQHDYPTDVLSFVLSSGPHHVNGEVIVSADTAAAACTQYGWQVADELLLYVIHGTLHLIGYDDREPALAATMRERERHFLSRFQLTPRYDEVDPAATDR